MILRGLDPTSQAKLMDRIRQRDGKMAEKVKELMIIWDDVLLVSDRSLQEVLRGVEARKLAMAVKTADERIMAKIRANISERASTMLDEELELLSEPTKAETEAGREEVLAGLRAINQKGELSFLDK